jgi:lactoylglutathione lyase
MVAVASLSYVILYVRDLEASAAFYRDAVGLLIKLRDAGYAEFVTGQTRFGLLERTRASALIRREPAQGGPAGEVLFVVDDIDAEAERLRGLGVEFLSGPVDRPWGHRTLKGTYSDRLPDRRVSASRLVGERGGDGIRCGLRLFTKQVSRPVDSVDSPSWPPRPSKSSETEERPGHGRDPSFVPSGSRAGMRAERRFAPPRGPWAWDLTEMIGMAADSAW